MNPSEAVLQHIKAWELPEARNALHRLKELPEAEQTQLTQMLEERDDLLTRLHTAEGMIASQPHEAAQMLQHLKGTPVDQHPRFEELLGWATEASLASGRAQLLEECRQVEELAAARRWPDARTRLDIAKSKVPNWFQDGELTQEVSRLETLIERSSEIEGRLTQLGMALSDEKWTEATELLNELRAWGVSEEELKKYSDDLDKLRAHAEGRSSRASQTDNLTAIQQSLENAKHWRSAYNHLQRLRDHLLANGKEEEARALLVKGDGYLEALHAHIAQVRESRIQDARVALAHGHLSEAQDLLVGARNAGHAPALAPGEPLDVIGSIPPTSEEGQEIAQLEATIKELVEKRQKAETYQAEIMAAMGTRTLTAMRHARSRLSLIEDLDPKLPGLQVLSAEVQRGFEAARAAEIGERESRLRRALERGGLTTGDEILKELRTLELPEEAMQAYEAQVKEAERRHNEAKQTKQFFDRIFATLQDDLDFSREPSLRQTLADWKAKAFDQAEIAEAEEEVDRFLAQRGVLEGDFRALNDAISTPVHLNEQKAAAERLAGSVVGQRPKIAVLLTRYWQAMAEEYREHGDSEVRYLRKAEKFAATSQEEGLKLQLQEQIRQVLARTEQGRQIAHLEGVLERALEQNKIQDGLDAIHSYPANDEVRQDPKIATLILQLNTRLQRQKAEKALDRAKNAAKDKDWIGALEAVQASLTEMGTIEAQLLQTEIQQQQAWEKRMEAELDPALKANLKESEQPDTLYDILQRGKLAASEVSKAQASGGLKAKAKRMEQLYQAWENQCAARYEQVKREVEDKVDNLEFTQALQAIEAVEQERLPDPWGVQVIELRRAVQGSQDVARRLEAAIDKAKELAAEGKFDEAARKLNWGTEVPKLLAERRNALQTQWGQAITTLADLRRELPRLRDLFQQLLDPESYEEASFRAAAHAVNESSSQVESLGLNKSSSQVGSLGVTAPLPIVVTYQTLHELIRWLQKVRGLETQPLTPAKLPGLSAQWEEVQKFGVPFADRLISDLGPLRLDMDKRLHWVDKRLEVARVAQDTQHALDTARPFRPLWGSTFAAQRDALDHQLKGNLLPTEHALLKDIKQRLDQKEREQAHATTLPLMAVGLSVLALLFLAFSRGDGNENGVAVIPTLPPTQTAVVVTATPTPTLTPSITPTPTVTPTPTATPETIAECTSTGMRRVLSEPGRSQDESDRAYWAGYVAQGETVRVLRDVPADPTLQADWFKVLIVRGGSETRAWIRRDWMNCSGDLNR